MKKADKNIEEAQYQTKKITAFALMSAADKRKEALEVKPKLNLALKMQVTKQDLKNRPHYQEVAEVFEEMLQAAEKGLDHLPERLNRAPGQRPNEIKLQKAQQEKDEQDRRDQKEAKRLGRDVHVKKLIKDTNFGGRGMAAVPYKEAQKKAEAEEAEKKKKEQNEARQAKIKEQQKGAKAKKETDLEEAKLKKKEEQAAENAKKKQSKVENKEKLEKQKTKIAEQFQDTYKRRDEVIARKEQQAETENLNKKRLNDQMLEYIKTSKPDRDVEKKERKDVQDFLDSKPVASLFDAYKKPLNQMYKFFAAQDDKKESATQSLEYLHSMLDLQEFIRFGFHMKVTPDLVSAEDMTFIYKNLLGESQDIANSASDAISVQNRTSGMLDYEAFKKAIVRISVMAQDKAQDEKIVGANQDLFNKDLLKEKLNRDRKIKDAEKLKRKELQDQIKASDAKKQAERDDLRKQFNEEQLERNATLSKQNLNKTTSETEPSARSSTLAHQKRDEAQKYALDQAALQEEDKFFEKWLRQREALGKKGASDANYASNRSGSVKKVKDPTQKELEEVKKQQKEASKLSNIVIEESLLTKHLDLKVINHETIEAFFRYLDLNVEDTEVEISRKLNASILSRMSAANRSPRGQDANYKSLTKKDPFKKGGLPVVEEKPAKVEDVDLDRNIEEAGKDEEV